MVLLEPGQYESMKNMVKNNDHWAWHGRNLFCSRPGSCDQVQILQVLVISEACKRDKQLPLASAITPPGQVLQPETHDS